MGLNSERLHEKEDLFQKKQIISVLNLGECINETYKVCLSRMQKSS